MKKGVEDNRDKVWKTTCTLLAVVFFFVGMPFLFTENPMWGVLSLIGVFFCGVAMMLAMRSKVEQKADDGVVERMKVAEQAFEVEDTFNREDTQLWKFANDIKEKVDIIVDTINESNLPQEEKKVLKEKAMYVYSQVRHAEDMSEVLINKYDVCEEMLILHRRYYQPLVDSVRQAFPYCESDDSLFSILIYGDKSQSF